MKLHGLKVEISDISNSYDEIVKADEIADLCIMSISYDEIVGADGFKNSGRFKFVQCNCGS